MSRNGVGAFGLRSGVTKALALAVGVLASWGGSHAQTFTNRDALRLLSATLGYRARAERASAIQWAAWNGFPTLLYGPEGPQAAIVRVRGNRPWYHAPLDRDAADTISTDEVYPGGSAGLNLTGTGVTLGIWEVGAVPFLTHVEFGNRISVRDGQTAFSDHATQVAGTMIAAGVDPQAKGMAYEGLLDAYDAFDDLGEAAAAAAAGLQVSNHSYAFVVGWSLNLRGDGRWAWLGDVSISEAEDYHFGLYIDESATWDQICYDAPYYQPVFGVGNNRGGGPTNQPVDHWILMPPDFTQWQLVNTVRDLMGGTTGYDTIVPGGQTAKNVLAIGAVDDIIGGYAGPGSVVMWSASNWGPTDDGRIKPDLVANGVGLYSPVTNNLYSSLTGTSAASPCISGSIGLLIQHYRNVTLGQEPWSSTIRALLFHTADEAGPYPGPDYMFGWGLMNTKTAALTISEQMSKDTTVQELVLQQGGQVKINIGVDGTKPLKVTIAWTDPPGTPPAPALDPPTRMLVNDLDVRVFGPGMTYTPWTLDPTSPSAPAVPGDNIRDNAEQIYIPNPTPGIYTVTVNHKGAQLQPNGEQAFSMVITGDTGRVKPTVDSIGVTPTILKGGASAIGTVQIAAPAPAGGFEVGLASSDDTIAAVPEKVDIPSGQTTATFPIKTFGVLNQEVITLTASGANAKTTTLTVLPPVVQVVSVNPWVVTGGHSVKGTVQLDVPTDGGDFDVQLSADSNRVLMDDVVTVLEGTRTATFTIDTLPVNTPTTVTIKATSGSTSVSTQLTIQPPILKSVLLLQRSVRGGGRAIGMVQLNAPAPPEDITVLLSSDTPSVATVPSSITIRSGQTAARFTVLTKKVTSSRIVGITATRGSTSITRNLIVRR